MLSSFNRLVPIPSALDASDAYHLDTQKLRKNVKEQGLSVVLASNPRNPTGQVLAGDDLKGLVSISQEEGTTLILDEFYSWYQYELGEGATVSAAEYVDNVDEDNVVSDPRYLGIECWVVIAHIPMST
jgi:aspartate/methionine/tyrosine aminotransferase